jgi:hypothetical protein
MPGIANEQHYLVNSEKNKVGDEKVKLLLQLTPKNQIGTRKLQNWTNDPSQDSLQSQGGHSSPVTVEHSPHPPVLQ